MSWWVYLQITESFLANLKRKRFNVGSVVFAKLLEGLEGQALGSAPRNKSQRNSVTELAH